MSIDRAWCQQYQYILPAAITLTDLARQSVTAELVQLCEAVTDNLLQRLTLLKFYSPTMRTQPDLEADLRHLAGGDHHSNVLEKTVLHMKGLACAFLHGSKPK